MDNPMMELARQVSELTATKLGQIQRVAQMTKILAVNARIEAGRAGEAGHAFAVVADEVNEVSKSVQSLASDLEQGLTVQMAGLDALGSELQGTRLADLALNMVDLIDRNLYERSCDVRWWATDSAVHLACAGADPAARGHATRRLGVILDSYTVYLDLWIADCDGIVIAHARPQRYPSVLGSTVADQPWFTEAKASSDGTHYSVADITTEERLDNAQVATYAAAIRRDGQVDGAVTGVLGIFFDWQPQAHKIVSSVRLGGNERDATRCMLIDRHGRVIAASNGHGILSETITLNTAGDYGHLIIADGHTIGYALTPGYETYPGLGWYGVISQK